MRGRFRVQRTLQNRLGQLLQKTVLPGYLFHRRTPLQQLIDQLPIQSHSISSQLVEKIVYTKRFTPSFFAGLKPCAPTEKQRRKQEQKATAKQRARQRQTRAKTTAKAGAKTTAKARANARATAQLVRKQTREARMPLEPIRRTGE